MSHQEYKKNIAFQGKLGAHSHLACKTYFPAAQYFPYENFEDVFAAVDNGEVNLGVIPIENSHAGRVSEIHNLLRMTELNIVGEFFLEIKHHLAAPAGSSLADITEVYSHPQALMQCSKTLKEHNLRKNSFINTAAAAAYIAEQNEKSKAALCSELAAEEHGLEIIKSDCQDYKNNRTIFIAIAKDIEELPSKSEKKITTLLFTVRNIPAAIYKALGGFATNNVNIIKLESYIPGGLSQEAQFFISFQGDTDSRDVQYALEELGFYTKKIKLLGVYDQAPERK